MELSATFDEDKNILLHGVWVAGLKISNRLIQSIASEFSHKPFRRCSLALSFKGLDLHVLPSLISSESFHDRDSISEDIKPGKSQHIAFSALRDFSMNPHNQHCMMVIFVDAKNRFSVLVFSCKNPRTLCDVIAHYKKLRNRKILQQPPSVPRTNDSAAIISGNWILRQQVNREFTPPPQVDSSYNNSVNLKDPNVMIFTHSQNGSSYTSIDILNKETEQATTDDGTSSRGSDGADKNYNVEREVATCGADNVAKTFHASVQVLDVDSGLDNDWVFFSGSLKSDSSSLVQEATSVTATDSSTNADISLETYHNRRIGVIPACRINGSENTNSFSSVPVANGNGQKHGDESDGNMVNEGAFTLRSVGTQTEPMTPTPQRGRYTKKPLKPSLSNQYKEKVAAVRKKSGSTTPTTTPSSPSSTTPLSHMSIGLGSYHRHGEPLQTRPVQNTSVLMRSKSAAPDPMVITSQHHRPLSMSLSSPPVLTTSRSTVSRSIETVYSRRLQHQTRPPGQEDKSEKQPSRGLTAAGPQRIVVLPNKQAVVLTRTGLFPHGNGYHQAVQPAQRSSFSAQPHLRTMHSNSGDQGDSRSSSRTNSLRDGVQSGYKSAGHQMLQPISPR